MEDVRGREIALFRYALVRQAADEQLSNADRGRLVRALADRDHQGPDGTRVRVGRSTLDRWIAAYRRGGFDALVPVQRAGRPLTTIEVLDLAVALKREAPERTAVQIADIIARSKGGAPSARTIQRHFARSGLNRRPTGTAPRAYGRFEAAARNDRWTGDALHGPTIAGRKSYLFAFVDDHSRLLVGYRWGRAEDTLRLEAALRRGLSSRGVPTTIYVDNGAAFVAAPLQRACAVLGIRLVHSKPGEPAGRGKIERLFRTVRSQFLVEVAQRSVPDLDELNALFAAWVEQVYHRREHRETQQAPLERFMAAGIPDVPAPELLREAFLWAQQRTVTKTALVSLAGNRYETDPVLIGRKVELIFDPFDLSEVEVRFNGQSFGPAAVHQLGTHVHPKATSNLEHADDMPAVHSGIDYLGLVQAEHRAATRRSINFTDLLDTDSVTPRSDEDGPARVLSAAPWLEPPLPFPDADHDGADTDDDDGTAAVAVSR
jgi:putative transposase